MTFGRVPKVFCFLEALGGLDRLWEVYGTGCGVGYKCKVTVKLVKRTEAIDMEKIYFTIAGTKHHYGQEYFEPKMEVRLVKEPDNEYDKEAIKVEMDGLGLVGYVANSPYTVQGESMSAGRLYDRIGDTAVGVVKYVLPQGVLCELVQ